MLMNQIEPHEIREGGASVLISGGSGLIGRHLSSLLVSQGFRVSILSRNALPGQKFRTFSWDPENKRADPAIFDGVDYLVHLSGVNMGAKRWTEKRKEEIVNSRVMPARFLHEVITENLISPRAFISASAVGYYGSITSGRIFKEEDPPASDFMGTTCRLWEEAADLFEKSGIRTVKIRTAVVLDRNDTAVGRLIAPARFGLVLRLGSGQQYFPWIHMEDLCNIYLKAIVDDNMQGAYNAVAPQHTSNEELMRTIAKVMHRPLFLPPVPKILLKAVLGEMSDIILKGSRVSGEKIINAGYRFRYDRLEEALKQILGS